MKLAIEKANIQKKDIDAIAVTNRPGLASSLLVGVTFAKLLSYGLQIPLIDIHHIEGHIYACFLEHSSINFPHISLTVSGGHTLLVLVKEGFSYEIIGTTTDDAAGEAFDKVARYLGLGFPGGPIIDKLSSLDTKGVINFKSPMIHSKDFNFSFSGLKTSVKYYIDSLDREKREELLVPIAKGFQNSLVQVLVKKTIEAAQQYKCKFITLSGGVAANSQLRKTLKEMAKKVKKEVYYPSRKLCTDNAAMIAGIAYHRFKQKQSFPYEIFEKSNSLLPS